MNVNKTLKKLFSLTLTILLVISCNKKNELNKNKNNEDFTNYKIHSIPIPDSLTFSGETVDLNENDLIQRFDKEILVNTYWQSNTLQLIKRSRKFFKIIEPILKKEGVPDDFKYLAVIESGLENLRSPKGAKGIWQIMRGTGRELGLEINNNVDERYNLELSTIAACRYIKKAKNKFGTWTLAAAAYNRGMSGVNRALKKQNVKSYYDLLLGNETRRYVFRIHAIKLILNNPNNYGFFVKDSEYYKDDGFEVMNVDYPIKNLSEFANKNGINYKTLKIFNPWLIQNHLNNRSKKKYKIKIPK
ncbi:MAG: lytic transglycosylase domain-containing protein [Bacteroidota bacterium]|nr:lytic transglycosylase domain-containing protein [Bacteroidota bacterium]